MGEAGATGLRHERTVCPFCSCGCGLYLRGSARGVEGVGPSEHHPVSGGRLCVRGWSAHEAAQWGPRLRTPMVREQGELRPASWDEALAVAMDGLLRLRDAGRPVGVLTSGGASNEESWLAATLARSALRTPHLDAPLRLQWDALLSGVRQAPAPGMALGRIEGSDLVVLLEDDLSVTHPRVALAVLRALRRGARLVTLAWQRTALSALASHHVPLDALDPLSTLKGLGAHGLEGWLKSSRRPCFLLSPFDADPALLRAASLFFAQLAAGVCDEDATPFVLPLPIRANTRGALDMGVAPDRLPGRRALTDAAARAALLAVWGADGCWDEGADAERMAGRVAGLVVVGEDLPAVHLMPAQAREQLGRLEHLVVLDAFLTETAAAAQVVLPMATFGESEGSVTSLDGRAQAFEPFAPPPGEARPGWEILTQLLAGLGARVRPRSAADVRTAIAASVPGYESLAEPAPETGWLVAWPALGASGADGDGTPARTEPTTHAAAGDERPAPSAEGEAPPMLRLRLRRGGAFDWEQDPLVRYSPTLRREAASRGRRFPHGLVAMNPSDAGALGVRDGWMVRLRTRETQVPVALALRAGVEPGMLLVPYAFREQLGAVLGAEGVAEVEVQPA